MQLQVSTTPPANLETELLLVPVSVENLDTRLVELSEELGPVVRRLEKDFSGEYEEYVLGYPEAETVQRVALIGLGSAEEMTSERLRRSIAGGSQIIRDYEIEHVTLRVSGGELNGEMHTQPLVEGLVLSTYQFDRYKTDEERGFGGVEQLTVWTETDRETHTEAARRGMILSEATSTARDLVNLSPDEKTATRFGEYITEAAEEFGYQAEIWNKERIVQEGMRGLLAVNRGSPEPPTFSILEWKPDNAANDRPVVLAGKGVMFDTGGLSLKSTKGSMDKMKSDMAGAAAVVGTMEAAARLELPLHVIGVIPATDNRPGENAYVPGDVLTMHSGTTVEVLNTDAEGRLILADALSYAKKFDPELVIDLATLTGAQVAALGAQAAAVCIPEKADSDARLAAFREAGRRSGDRVEPLPMYDEYATLLESPVADIKNVGGRQAGAVTAAKFLQRFVEYDWVHLDIAGPAFFDSSKNYRRKGGTGFGVRLLFEYLNHYFESR